MRPPGDRQRSTFASGVVVMRTAHAKRAEVSEPRRCFARSAGVSPDLPGGKLVTHKITTVVYVEIGPDEEVVGRDGV